jgi:predicted RND superfamily exporter protein
VGLLMSLTSGMAALALLSAPGRPGSRIGESVDVFTAQLGARFAPLTDAVTAGGRAVLGAVISRPVIALAAALALAVAGWAVQPGLDVESDVRKLVESDLSELRDVDEVERLTGVGGELSVAVSGSGVTEPATIEWMAEVKSEILDRNGYDEELPCNESDAAICPAAALPDLFGDERPTRGEVTAILDAVPEYFSQAVLTPPGAERRMAAITFGIRQTPLDEQKRLVDGIREILRGEGEAGPPPEGIVADAVGLPVLAADANAALADARHWLPIAGIAAVVFVLALIRRSGQRVAGPVLPVALATGWSSLVLWAMGVSLNPMSATLGALVVALGTEFSVILESRFREERDHGAPIGEALRATFARTGTAVVASAATAIAGFGVLAFSGIGMLSEFGLVTVVDLTVALLGVLIVLPAVLVILERDG